VLSSWDLREVTCRSRSCTRCSAPSCEGEGALTVASYYKYNVDHTLARMSFSISCCCSAMNAFDFSWMFCLPITACRGNTQEVSNTSFHVRTHTSHLVLGLPLSLQLTPHLLQLSWGGHSTGSTLRAVCALMTRLTSSGLQGSTHSLLLSLLAD